MGQRRGHQHRLRHQRLQWLHLLDLVAHHTADEGGRARRVVERHLAASIIFLGVRVSSGRGASENKEREGTER